MRLALQRDDRQRALWDVQRTKDSGSVMCRAGRSKVESRHGIAITWLVDIAEEMLAQIGAYAYLTDQNSAIYALV